MALQISVNVSAWIEGVWFSLDLSDTRRDVLIPKKKGSQIACVSSFKKDIFQVFRKNGMNCCIYMLLAVIDLLGNKHPS